MNKTRKITISALFTAISIVLTRYFSIMVPLGGFPSMSIELGGLPIMMSGIMLGPVAGGIVGAASDIIGFFFINNRGSSFYHPGFTLNAILTGVIPGLLALYFRSHPLDSKKLMIVNLTGLVIMSGVSIFYLANTSLSTDLIWLRPLFIGIIIVVALGLIFALFYLQVIQKKRDFKVPLLQIVFMVMCVEVFVYIALTPIWIYGIYGIPSIFSILSRVFRAVLMIPVKAFLLATLLSVLPSFSRRDNL